MKKSIVLLLIISFIASAHRLIGTIDFIVPKNWPQPEYDFTKNPLASQKIELGRALFYDPILSRDSTISCASCHSQYSAFTHIDHPFSHGIDNKIGTRNAPALMNLAWNKSFMWDGAVTHLDMQALAPMGNPDEMDESLKHVVAKLQHNRIYPKLFFNAFGDSTITGEHTLKAISQFMLTLVSCNSKYDSVMRQEATFTSQEKNGYTLFQANCASCHKEPLFTNNKFENNGLSIDTSLNDIGRMRITQDSANYLQFKVPTLRNIQYSYPYMHDGRFTKLQQVLNHYTNGIVRGKTVSKQLQKPIILTSNEKVDIIAFLYTLSDKDFVFNKNYGFPKNILLR
jgi:cytochrome c peroxidase